SCAPRYLHSFPTRRSSDLDPLYKKIDFTNLFTMRGYSGKKVPFKIHRQGQPMQLEVTLEHRSADDYIIPPYSRDEAPQYYILGRSEEHTSELQSRSDLVCR